MTEPLLDHPRALTERVASVLGGSEVACVGLTGFLSSRFDRFLNQLFADGRIAPRVAADALDGRAGFVWLTEEPVPEELRGPGAERLLSVSMSGMTATTAPPIAAPTAAADLVEVRSHDDLEGWHAVYCDVFGADPRGRDDWRKLHDALGPAGDGSLVLLLARVEESPAATAAVYFDREWAGLYCFTTRERMRGRGLASALVDASHAAARARNIEQALLHATPMGRPVYARAGYQEVRALPLLVSA